MLEIYLRLPGRQGKDHHRGIGISRIHSDVGAVSVCAEGRAWNQRVENSGLNCGIIRARKNFAMYNSTSYSYIKRGDLSRFSKTDSLNIIATNAFIS